MVEIDFSDSPQKLTSRVCTLNDYDFVFGLVESTIFPLVREFSEPDPSIFKRRFKEDYFQRRIVLKGEQKIGFYQLRENKNFLEVLGLFIDGHNRGNGIGAYIMRKFERLGFNTIRLRVFENNPAIQFYKRLGYNISSKEGHKYVMEKILQE